MNEGAQEVKIEGKGVQDKHTQNVLKKFGQRIADSTASHEEPKETPAAPEPPAAQPPAAEPPKPEATPEPPKENTPSPEAKLTPDLEKEAEALFKEVVNKETPAPAPGQPSAETVDKLSPEYKAKIEDYDRIMSNPLLKQFVEHSKVSDLEEIFAELVSSPKDYDKMSEPEILTEYFKSLGMNDDQIKQDIETWGAQPNYKKASEMASIKDQLKKSKPAIPSRLQALMDTPEYKTARETKIKANMDSINSQREAGDYIAKEVQKITDYNGIEITPEVRTQILNNALNFTVREQKEGKYVFNTSKAVDNALKVQFFDSIIKSKFDEGVKQGINAALKKRIRPEAGEGNAVIPGKPVDKGDFKQAARDLSRGKVKFDNNKKQ